MFKAPPPSLCSALRLRSAVVRARSVDVFEAAAEQPFPESYRVDREPAPHALLEPVLGFLGVWRGRGRGGYPTLDGDFAYAQEVRFSHEIGRAHV